MQRFKKLGVFLHNCPADDAALAYTGRIVELAQSASVHCVYVRDPGSDEEAGDAAAIKQRIQAKLPEPLQPIANIEVHEGTGVPEILQTARDDEFDLIIVGRRLPSDQLGIGTAFARLARKAPCNVLVVPNQRHPHLGRVCVPVDFSEHAKLALEQGIAIASASGEATPQFIVHTNSSIGYGYAKLGMTLAQAIADREATYRKRLKDYMAGMDTKGLPVELVVTTADDTDSAILDVAMSHKMDLLVMGSRGEGSMFMLGSTSERVLLSAVVPVLIVKQKGETRSVLDALFGK